MKNAGRWMFLLVAFLMTLKYWLTPLDQSDLLPKLANIAQILGFLLAPSVAWFYRQNLAVFFQSIRVRQTIVIIAVDVSSSMTSRMPSVRMLVFEELLESIDLQNSKVGFLSFSSRVWRYVAPRHYRHKASALEVFDRIVITEVGPESAEGLASALQILGGFSWRFERRLVVVSDRRVRGYSTLEYLEERLEEGVVNLECHNIVFWPGDHKIEEFCVLGSKRPTTRLCCWVATALAAVLIVFFLRCYLGSILGQEIEIRNDFEVSRDIEGEVLLGKGKAGMNVTARSGAIEALRGAYMDALGPNTELRHSLAGIPLEDPGDISQWLLASSSGDLIPSNEFVSANWLGCCSDAYVTILDIGTPRQPAISDRTPQEAVQEVVVELVSEQLESRYNSELKRFELERSSESEVHFALEDLEHFVGMALDRDDIDELLQKEGVAPDSALNALLTIRMNKEMYRIERFESGEFRFNFVVEAGFKALGRYLRRKLSESRVEDFQIVAVGFTDQDPVGQIAYSDPTARFVRNQYSCPPTAEVLEQVSPSTISAAADFTPIFHRIIDPRPRILRGEDWQALVAVAPNSEEIAPDIRDNCELSFARGYEGIQYLARALEQPPLVGGPVVLLGYSGQGTQIPQKVRGITDRELREKEEEFRKSKLRKVDVFLTRVSPSVRSLIE